MNINTTMYQLLQDQQGLVSSIDGPVTCVVSLQHTARGCDLLVQPLAGVTGVENVRRRFAFAKSTPYQVLGLSHEMIQLHPFCEEEGKRYNVYKRLTTIDQVVLLPLAELAPVTLES